jgi:GntR family transcriptional regulator/MocR family aminotransferase
MTQPLESFSDHGASGKGGARGHRGKRESSLDLAVSPPVAEIGKQAWVYETLRGQILGGALAAQARVPSTRSLAQRMGVSRSTVEWAYDQLRAEGYVVGVPGSGTYVCAQVPDRFLEPERPASIAARPGPPTPPTDTGRLNAGFIARVADPGLFPMAEWKRCLAHALRTTPVQALADEDPRGSRALREQIARYLGAARGIACDPDQILVVSGIRHAIDLCARVLVGPGDTTLVEDPCYPTASTIFRGYTDRVIPLPIDAHGFSVTEARRHEAARLVHVTPAHQSPTGVTMPISRRLELLAWAQAQGAWLIEDDYDSEFNYQAAPLPALKSLDQGDRVIHCGSFNKTLFAGLRIGYAVVPRALASRFLDGRYATGRSISVLEQAALARFLESGAFARHVRRSRAVYAQRRARVVEALQAVVPREQLHLTGEQGGFHFAWWLPPGLTEAAFLERAARVGLRFQGLGALCHRSDLPPAVLVGDSAMQDEALAAALGRLPALLAG